MYLESTKQLKDTMYDAQFHAAMNALVDHIKADYATWSNLGTQNQDPISVKVRAEMTERFNESVRFERGSKYLKVVSSGSAHCFVVLNDGPKFKRGDILKAASWKAPATNYARGNVLNGNLANVVWTGAL